MRGSVLPRGASCAAPRLVERSEVWRRKAWCGRQTLRRRSSAPPQNDAFLPALTTLKAAETPKKNNHEAIATLGGPWRGTESRRPQSLLRSGPYPRRGNFQTREEAESWSSNPDSNHSGAPAYNLSDYRGRGLRELLHRKRQRHDAFFGGSDTASWRHGRPPAVVAAFFETDESASRANWTHPRTSNFGHRRRADPSGGSFAVAYVKRRALKGTPGCGRRGAWSGLRLGGEKERDRPNAEGR